MTRVWFARLPSHTLTHRRREALAMLPQPPSASSRPCCPIQRQPHVQRSQAVNTALCLLGRRAHRQPSALSGRCTCTRPSQRSHRAAAHAHTRPAPNAKQPRGTPAPLGPSSARHSPGSAAPEHGCSTCAQSAAAVLRCPPLPFHASARPLRRLPGAQRSDAVCKLRWNGAQPDPHASPHGRCACSAERLPAACRAAHGRLLRRAGAKRAGPPPRQGGARGCRARMRMGLQAGTPASSSACAGPARGR